jgi:NAD+ kinase
MRIELLGGTFSPITVEHLAMAESSARNADEVVIIPCGIRPDKESANDISPNHRATMIDLALKTLPPKLRAKIKVDYFDLERDQFMPNHELQQRYASRGAVRHIVGADLIAGGADQASYIHRVWQRGAEMWKTLDWTVYQRAGYNLNPADLPPKHKVRRTSSYGPPISSDQVRTSIYKNEPINGLVVPEVEAYIKRYSLYRGRVPLTKTKLVLDEPRLKIIASPHSPPALEAAERFRKFAVKDNYNLILAFGGDSTLLSTTKEHWQERIPILGVNFGRVGHNLSGIADKFSPEMLRQPLEVWMYPLIYVQAQTPEGKKLEQFAFNDAWVCSNSVIGQSVYMAVHVNGRMVIPFAQGDGMLVAAPQGSTGYARSMGATPVRIARPELLLVGNNLSEPAGWKQANLDMTSQIRISNADLTRHRKLYACADSTSLGEVEEMTVRASRFASVELAFIPGYGPLSKLDKIQFPLAV